MATAGAGTGAAAADAFVSRLQSLVHKASESNRLPRWLRRAIPHDAGPGASIAVVAAFAAAVIVAVVVIATVASALTSGGGSAPQAGSGIGLGAPSGAAGLPQCNAQDDLTGTAALPVSGASVARSYQQQILACYQETVSVTCDNPQPIVASEDAYTCTIVQNPNAAIILQSPDPIWVTLTNGHWIDETE
jgi:hypothetical protein